MCSNIQNFHKLFSIFQVLGEHMAYHNTIQNILEFPQHVSPGIPFQNHLKK